MKLFFLITLSTFVSLAAAQTSSRIVVERPVFPVDSSKLKEEAPPDPHRMSIDPGQMIYQMQVDSINRIAEDKVRGLIRRMERRFNDEKTEEEIGRLIGEAVIEQQMALLDLQMERAISLKDTLLMMGLKTAVSELMNNSDLIQRELDKLLREIESETESK